MSFPRYPKYKDSGVEWLGEVPADWRVLPLARVATSRCDGPFGSSLKSEHYTETGVRVIRLQNIRREGFDGSDTAFIDSKYYQRELAGHDVVRGDLLIAGLGDDNNVVGRACVAPVGIEPALVKADCFRFRLDPTQALTAFVAVALCSSAEADAGRLATGSTRSRIPLSEMSSRKVPVPPLAEQLAIAAFLERETAKIDALVAEQQRLIELLNEKRQAVISHAVTKGLNRDAPMKDSGVAWLGKVPAHWGTSQSRRMFRVRSEQALDSDRQLTASQKHGVIFQSDFVELEGRRVVEVIMWTENLLHVEPDDFIISMRSFQGGIEWCRLRGSTSYHYVMLTPVKDVHPPFFAHVFKRAVYIQALRATTNLIRDGQELRYSHFAQVPLPVAPMDEQARIAAFLDVELARFDALTAEAQRAIDLLRERRTALISAAVTGQIDVRDAAATAAA